MSLFKMLKNNTHLVIKGSKIKSLIAALFYLFSVFFFRLLEFLIITSFNSFSPKILTDETSLSQSVDRLFSFSMLEILIAIICFVGTLLLCAPIYFGIKRWYYNIVNGLGNSLFAVFYFFKSTKLYFRSLRCYISLYIRIFFWSFVFLLVPNAIILLSLFSFYAGNVSSKSAAAATIGVILAVILYILAIFMLAAYSNKYRLVPYLIQESDSNKISDIFKTSISYTKGYKLKFLFFDLSLIGWALLSLLIIPMFYTIPYLNGAGAMFSRYITEKKRYLAAKKNDTAPIKSAPKRFSATDETIILPNIAEQGEEQNSRHK